MFQSLQRRIQRPDIFVGSKMNLQIDAKLAFFFFFLSGDQMSLHWAGFICKCIKQNYLLCYVIYNLHCCKIAQRQWNLQTPFKESDNLEGCAQITHSFQLKTSSNSFIHFSFHDFSWELKNTWVVGKHISS